MTTEQKAKRNRQSTPSGSLRLVRTRKLRRGQKPTATMPTYIAGRPTYIYFD
jgi:hypothetical protein